jgi:glycosyltransferase involved in cell wall biosynthesis
MTEKIVAVVPAYNEENTINTVLCNVKKYVDEIVVIDDASTDKTIKMVKKNYVTLIKHKKNQGYDKSLNDGFQEAVNRNATIIFTFDADGQHVSHDIPAIIAPIKNRQADIVVGIRPYKQRIAETIFSWYAKKSIGISDPLCGFKAYSVKVYETVGYFDKLNSIGTELMFNSYILGYKLQEVPINMNKREDIPRFGNIFRANLNIFIALIKIIIKFKKIH